MQNHMSEIDWLRVNLDFFITSDEMLTRALVCCSLELKYLEVLLSNA